MAHFNINLLDQRSNGSLAAAYGANTANLNSLGETNPIRTSGSQNPTATLTSYSVSEMLQGSATYRPQGFAYDAFNQTISSDLGYLIRSEGGENQLLAGRQGLLAQDILRREGFNDGIFSDESGMVGLGGGQGVDTPGTIPPNPNTPTQRPPSSGAVEDLLRWCEEHSGPNGTPIPYSREQGTAPTHANGGQTSGRYGMSVCDCTGFCTSAYFFGMGIQINSNDANMGYTGSMVGDPQLLSVEVTFEDRQPGDLMIAHDNATNDGHGCIYYGQDQIVGTSSQNNGTWITENWMHTYYPNLTIHYFRVANLG